MGNAILRYSYCNHFSYPTHLFLSFPSCKIFSMGRIRKRWEGPYRGSLQSLNYHPRPIESVELLSIYFVALFCFILIEYCG